MKEHLFMKELRVRVLISFDYLSESVVRKKTSTPETDAMFNKFEQLKAPMINGYKNIHEEIAGALGLSVVENKICAELTREYGAGDQPYASQQIYSLCTLKS